MIGIDNSGGPEVADKKIEQNVSQSNESLQKEIEDKEFMEKQQGALNEFDKIRRFGFVTQKDLDEHVEKRVTDLVKNLKEQMERLHHENMQWREYFRSRGINSGAMDSPKEEESSLKAWERPFFKDMRR